jgi:hypothetical protein
MALKIQLTEKGPIVLTKNGKICCTIDPQGNIHPDPIIGLDDADIEDMQKIIDGLKLVDGKRYGRATPLKAITLDF